MEVSGNAEVEYIITWDPDDSGGSQPVNDGNTHTTINGLNSNTKYTFQVQASNDGGVGEISNKETYATSK